MKPLNCNHWFDPHIRKVIDLWSHPVWFISKKEEQCHCLNDVSKQPNPDCPTCLGLGNKLRFTREYAANLNLAASIRATGIGIAEKNIMNVYYTKNNKDIDIDIKPGDIVYDATELDQVSDIMNGLMTMILYTGELKQLLLRATEINCSNKSVIH